MASSGEWKNDVRHGWGTLHYPNGDIYQGNFINGKKQGTGVMTFSAPSPEEILSGLVADEDIGFDSEVHRGQWENDLPQGFGIRNYPNGQVSQELFICFLNFPDLCWKFSCRTETRSGRSPSTSA